MTILTLEASTASAKAMIYDSEKGPIKLITEHYDKARGDISAYDADDVYDAMISAGKKAADGFQPDVVALGGTWHSLLACDENMQPVTPTYSWAYVGAAKDAAEIRANKELTNELYNQTGCMVHGIYPLYKLLHLKHEGMDLKKHYFFGQGSYNFFKMTGERLTSESMASGSAMLNTHDKRYNEMSLSLVGINENQLPLVTTYKESRPLLKKVADELGIRPGIPVTLPHPDGALNQVGAGALEKGIMTLSVGTSGAIRLSTDMPILPKNKSTWCYLAPEKWLSGAATSGATNCVDWFISTVNSKRYSYGDLEKMIQNREKAPVFLPFISGERCPGWHDSRLATFHNLAADTTIGDMYYAVLEGVLFNLYHCYNELINISGKPDIIRVSGGVCKSALWLGMLTDIWQADIEISDIEQASMLGAAVLGMYTAGVITDLTEYKVVTDKILKPDKKAADFYAARFEKYMKAYNSFE
ncbi:MAG: FGGY-family carbohydrate kinase [Oscillospiraceae bacterium]|nr:FGGY-family carbohydrate kinase [Oscillospiraceae bacterium]